jgi:hypothetical protein
VLRHDVERDLADPGEAHGPVVEAPARRMPEVEQPDLAVPAIAEEAVEGFADGLQRAFEHLEEALVRIAEQPGDAVLTIAEAGDLEDLHQVSARDRCRGEARLDKA